ncbi:class I SAM-dependent methyltransferase [Desulfatiglans anilini]|uniref:class I SAM-dependent methyltransferase n=1 Tax=Desulfatiglans anilini TaxID=90728 RepID=UPI001ABFEBFB|nr:class I SAM-dependent methyltransferase [Desulfatiglans anilini]
MQSFSIDKDLILKILNQAKPLGHHTDKSNLNLGFGFLYYGLVRSLRPKHVVIIGSGYGFSVVCMAIAMIDNAVGKMSFIDPSYNLLKDGPIKTMGGRGNWNNPEDVNALLNQFDIAHIVNHYKMTSEHFFNHYENYNLPSINLAFIDGNHSFENVRFDFINVLKRSKKNSYILLHDTNIYMREAIRNTGVKRWLKYVKANKYIEVVDFPYSSGVAITRVLKVEAWKYLPE